MQTRAPRVESASTGEMGNHSCVFGKWMNQGDHGRGAQNEEWDRGMTSGH